ncbi:hypothetical protein [Chryseobacterium pennipullorum]|uniref:Uncharacterized protein n=1 Tax=Chryseobacterium pennipullorum TaxID=2258963 RepID=A0A3D9B956_9FLAO|nr:hypothetical protein [Chryseobacterium pennipullorum]REC50244.1 hypothetical protein DRF67_01570 [Chryseobacterium pennipullorum]
MELTDFHELTQEISSECFFMTEAQQEEKVIQLIDLHHFVECFDRNIKILSYLHHPINIIEYQGTKTGILFCDLKHAAVPDSNASEEFRRRYGLSELWFVFVEETSIPDTAIYTDAIIENSLDIFYEKIFTFNFFQSVIHPLK